MSWRREVFSILADLSSSEQDRANALDLKRQHLPSRLFRYQPLNDKSLATLGRSQVWLSPPCSFNDPFDSAVTFSMTKVFDEIRTAPKVGYRSELYKVIQGDDSRLPSFMRDYTNEQVRALGEAFSRTVSQLASDDLRGQLGVCCMSASGTSVPMWAHYAAQHTGFCVELDPSTWAEQVVRDHLFPVIYDRDPPNFPYLHFRPHYAGAAALLAMWKSPDWSYEQEWRLTDWRQPIGDGRPLELQKPVAVHAGVAIPDESFALLDEVCSGLNVRLLRAQADPVTRTVRLGT